MGPANKRFLPAPYEAMPGKKGISRVSRDQKRLDIFFTGMLIRVALNEYSFRMAGGSVEPVKKLNKIQEKTAALPLHGE